MRLTKEHKTRIVFEKNINKYINIGNLEVLSTSQKN